MTTATPSLTRRILAGTLAFLIGFGPLATPGVFAQTPTKLADEPLAVTNSAKSNIVMTVDDSTSMLFDFLPDYVIDAYCRDKNGLITAIGSRCGTAGSNTDLTFVGAGKYTSPGYISQQYNYPYQAYSAGRAGLPFDTGGPGSGCDMTIGAFGLCSSGVSPGASPGVPLYPTTSPKRGTRYEYNQLWPAPVHNSAFNHLYYNPELTYDPPVYEDGTSYQSMNSGNTSAWTKVPADPWAATVLYIDLTAGVTVGQWCNSDFTMGLAGDPAHCRTNGMVAVSYNGDYTYPWVPTGMDSEYNLGYQGDNVNPTAAKYTIGMSLAYSKVNSGTKAILPAWSGGVPKDTKYFYQNDNVIWCDATHALWPQGGPSVGQTCTGFSNVAQTCGGGNAQTCSGSAQTCGSYVAQTCLGSTAQTCNAIAAQTCNGYTTQTCGAITGQTCNGYTTQTCGGVTAQTCNGYSTQTCDNIVNVGDVCVNKWSPPGCDACGFKPECPPCELKPDCTPTMQGKCTKTLAACTALNAATVCTPVNGKCSLSMATCQPVNAATQCPGQGKCSTSMAACTVANAATVCTPINGKCSISMATCQPVNAATQCPATGKCSTSMAACTAANAATVCTPINGKCSATMAACQPPNAATQCPPIGRCSTSMAFCNAANAATVCPNLGGRCSITMNACTPANAATNCPQQGKCSITMAVCTAANAATTCPVQAKKCSITMAACTTTCPNANTTCSITGAACSLPPASGNAACPNQVTPGTCSISGAVCNGSCPNLPSASASATCSNMLSDASKSLLEDANSTGVVCRRNNRNYGGSPAADQFNFPSGKYVTPVTAGTGANACTATPRFATVPRHYWKTSVEWCDNTISAAGDKWNGYGDGAVGSCQPYRDATHVVPRFHQFGTDPGTENVVTGAFERVDLDFVNKPNYKHVFKDDTGTVVTINRTFVEEVENYANWFAYYRTRIQAVKTVTSLAFLGKTLGQYNVDDKYRVGLHTLSNKPLETYAKFVDIQDFNLAQKKTWATELFAIDIPLGKDTPTLDAMIRIGEWFAAGSSVALSGATDPIKLSCQKNWHMLFTDGITNQPLPTLSVNNIDNKVPAFAGVFADLSTAGLTPGADWPPPFRENISKAIDNAASDYATYYWAYDFRTGGAMATNNVPVSASDPANWQHLNFAAMSLGTEGKLPAGNQGAVEAQLKAGAVQWPEPWPTTNKPDASGVDDLWHAAMNSRGRFVNADNSDELQAGMGAILADIANQAGARAGAQFQGSNLSGANAYIYRVRFEPGWGGSLAKVNIDPVTGKEGTDVWEASTQLAAALVPTVAVPKPWFDNRKIVTMDDKGVAVPFLWASLSAAQQDALAPGNATRGNLALEYLRGSAQNEGAKKSQFRARSVPLGDIVNSQAVYVGAPNLPYNTADNPGYDTFKASYKGREARVYVGANDGMLHAFDDKTGNETFAYVPHDLYRPPAAWGLGALTLQLARLPRFQHHYYVDATPRAVDIDFDYPNQKWGTVLAGGLGKGGKSYYAIDVTQPADFTSETEVAKKVLWEFTNADLGYTYGRPVIAKTAAFGGKWLAMLPSGYNNTSGIGKVFFVDAATGTLVKTMSTGVGDPDSPAGLAQMAAFTKNMTNLKAEQIYAGDLLGNFWRFDVSDADDTKWVVEKLAVLTEPGTGARQPVTTPPQIEIDINNAIDRWVFVGTGKLLHNDDLADAQRQTFYALRDGSNSKPNVIAAPLTRADLIVVTDEKGLASRPDKGWYDDLPAGERVTVGPQAVISIVAYSGTRPQTDPCLTGLPATIYAREFSRGNSVLEDDFGNIVESIDSPSGAVGMTLLSLETGGPPGTPPVLRIAITQGSDGRTKLIKVKTPEFLSDHRMSWRLLGE